MAATYDARINELRDLLAQCPAAADDRVNEGFNNLIKRYNEVRQSALDDLVDFMAKASISNLGTASKWQSRIERFRSDLNEAFANAARDVIAKIENARSSGLDITADQYPYVAGATSLGASVPPWAHEGGTAKFVERLKDPATREKLKKEMRAPSDKWENFYLGAGGGGGVLIASVLNRDLAKYEGKRINEIARMMGEKDELDSLFDLLIADNAQTGMIIFLMSEDDVKLALRQPWVSVGIDHGEVALTGPLAEGNAHPRGYGSFPRILGRYVRDEHVLTLEEAIRKMTSLAANRVHLADRGIIKPGFFADVVVFDPENIHDVATFEDPNRLSIGMRFVVVNGEPVVFEGKQTTALPGRPLKGPGFKSK